MTPLLTPTASEMIAVTTETLTACPGCSHTQFTPWCVGYDRLHRICAHAFVYSKCSRCGLIFQSERPVEAEIGKFYPENYGPYAGAEASPRVKKQKLSLPWKLLRLFNVSLVKALLPDRFGRRLCQLQQVPYKKGVLLDFGCGSDRYLNDARAQGWETLGIDFSEHAVRQVNASGHRGLLMSAEVWDQIPDGSLGFVRMSHVFEHLYHPQEILSRLASKMSDGAVLHVIMPNPSGYSAQWFKSRWWGLECPRHIMLYPPALFQKMLMRQGFHQMTLLQETTTKDAARSLGYWLHDLGKLPAGEVEAMAERPDLEVLLYPMARVASLLGKADRYHVFAVKRET